MNISICFGFVLYACQQYIPKYLYEQSGLRIIFDKLSTIVCGIFVSDNHITFLSLESIFDGGQFLHELVQ